MEVLKRASRFWIGEFRYQPSTRSAWILLAFSTFYVLTIFYCRSTNYRDPTSLFFDARRAYTRRYSTHRSEQADAYITSLNVSERHSMDSVQPALLCLGIATVARRGTQYVRTTVGSLFAGLSEAQRDLISFNLLIGHTDPGQHPVFTENWVDILPDRLLKYPTDEFEQIRAWEEGGWYRNKSIHDYRYLLNACQDTGAEYVAIIEDDTLAVEGWMPRLMAALDEVQAEMQGYSSRHHWIYLRLFYADYLLGWNSEQWATYLFWSFSVWSSLTVMMWMIRRYFPRRRELLPADTLAVISIVCIPAMILLFFLAGKQTMMPIRPGVREMSKYGCCSQGFVYPRNIIPHILDELRTETKGLVDTQVEKIADAGKYVRWATVPPLLQHIGVTSSKGYGFDDNAQQIWSFRYEEYPYD